MKDFIPGQIIKTFFAKDGTQVTLRYPMIEDLDEFTSYINKLSSEDTYITYSGEEVSRDDEEKFLKEKIEKIEQQDSILLCAFDGKNLIGICNIDRDFSSKKRGLHKAILGLSINNDYRSEGIGMKLAESAIEEAKNNIPGLRMILLKVYSENKIAQKLYKKLGFKIVGTIPGGILYKNTYIAEIEMMLPF